MLQCRYGHAKIVLARQASLAERHFKMLILIMQHKKGRVFFQPSTAIFRTAHRQNLHRSFDRDRLAEPYTIFFFFLQLLKHLEEFL
jgi:hypothetical protein